MWSVQVVVVGVCGVGGCSSVMRWMHSLTNYVVKCCTKSDEMVGGSGGCCAGCTVDIDDCEIAVSVVVLSVMCLVHGFRRHRHSPT